MCQTYHGSDSNKLWTVELRMVFSVRSVRFCLNTLTMIVKYVPIQKDYYFTKEANIYTIVVMLMVLPLVGISLLLFGQKQLLR